MTDGPAFFLHISAIFYLFEVKIIFISSAWLILHRYIFLLFLSYRFRFFFFHFYSLFESAQKRLMSSMRVIGVRQVSVGAARVGETEGDYPGAEWNKKGNCIALTLSVMSHGEGRG